MILKPSSSKTVLRFASRCVVSLLTVAGAAFPVSVSADEAPTAQSYAVAMAIDVNGEQSEPRVLAKTGEKFALASGEWRLEMTVRQAQTPGDVWLLGKIFIGSDIVSAPKLLAHINEKATIKVDDGNKPFTTLSMIVSPQP